MGVLVRFFLMACASVCSNELKNAIKSWIFTFTWSPKGQILQPRKKFGPHFGGKEGIQLGPNPVCVILCKGKLMSTESQFYFANISATKARIFMKFYVVVNYYLRCISISINSKFTNLQIYIFTYKYTLSIVQKRSGLDR